MLGGGSQILKGIPLFQRLVKWGGEWREEANISVREYLQVLKAVPLILVLQRLGILMVTM